MLKRRPACTSRVRAGYLAPPYRRVSGRNLARAPSGNARFEARRANKTTRGYAKGGPTFSPLPSRLLPFGFHPGFLKTKTYYRCATFGDKKKQSNHAVPQRNYCAPEQRTENPKDVPIWGEIWRSSCGIIGWNLSISEFARFERDAKSKLGPTFHAHIPRITVVDNANSLKLNTRR